VFALNHMIQANMPGEEQDDEGEEALATA
jgi:hypothetical protein